MKCQHPSGTGQLEEVKALFPGLIYTENVTKERRLVKYTLVGLHRAVPNPVKVDYEPMTIEHLAPQSLIGTNGFTDSLIGQCGNLILVPEGLNDKLANKSFTEKKAVLAQAGYKIPVEIDQVQEWGKEQIAARTRSMAEKAYNDVWRI